MWLVLRGNIEMEHKGPTKPVQGRNGIGNVSRETPDTAGKTKDISLNPLDFRTAIKGVLDAGPMPKPVGKKKK
jgi:hypothetical protein